MKIEEIDVEKLGSSFSFREKEAYSMPLIASFQNAFLVRASTGESNVYLTADIVNYFNQKLRVICFFEEKVEEKLREDGDQNWSSKPTPFKGEVTGFLSDWVRGVGLTLHQCQIHQNAS